MFKVFIERLQHWKFIKLTKENWEIYVNFFDTILLSG